VRVATFEELLAAVKVPSISRSPDQILHAQVAAGMQSAVQRAEHEMNSVGGEQQGFSRRRLQFEFEEPSIELLRA
jgi:hypothetical protein